PESCTLSLPDALPICIFASFSSTILDLHLPRLVDAWYRVFTDLRKIPGEQFLFDCRVEYVVLSPGITEGHDAVALGSGESNVEQAGRLVSLGLGAATHGVSLAQTFLQRPEVAEDPRHQPERTIRQRISGVEDRGLLHRDLPVPVVFVSRDSDNDDRPLQAFRLMHRRHQHGIMSRRLFV